MSLFVLMPITIQSHAFYHDFPFIARDKIRFIQYHEDLYKLQGFRGNSNAYFCYLPYIGYVYQLHNSFLLAVAHHEFRQFIPGDLYTNTSHLTL